MVLNGQLQGRRRKKMTVEIYIDEDKDTIIVGKPQFEYEITHTELDTQFDKKKIWVKRK